MHHWNHDEKLDPRANKMFSSKKIHIWGYMIPTSASKDHSVNYGKLYCVASKAGMDYLSFVFALHVKTFPLQNSFIDKTSKVTTRSRS